jgi:glycosyltransferase involved in cell wall biosynthesis
MGGIVLSLIIPLYKNEENLERLLAELVKLEARLAGEFEAVLVVDGSPDACYRILADRLPSLNLRSQLLLLSRNFGSFAAIHAGLAAAQGDYFAVMAADLQEPPELALEFLRVLQEGTADVVFGCRSERSDPFPSELLASTFWWIYRKLVVRELPPGGVDVFGCTQEVRDHVIRFREVNSSLIVLLFWLGFRRQYIPYKRAPRLEGKSAWTAGKKLRYCIDSIFNFTDLPIQLLLYGGVAGMTAAVVFGTIAVAARLRGAISVPGYTPIVLAILFFGALTSLGLGIVGQYAWLALQNSRGRPTFVVAESRQYHKSRDARL